MHVPFRGAVSIRSRPPTSRTRSSMLRSPRPRRARALNHLEPLPVVGDRELHFFLDAPHRHVNLPGVGVFGDIAQRLLDDAVETQREREIRDGEIAVGLDDHGDGVLLGKLAAVASQGIHQTACFSTSG